MKIHKLKTIPKYFREAAKGNKPFEVRKNDRRFEVGDILQLEEWLPKEKTYTGKTLFGEIRYILSDRQYCKKGYVILGIPKYIKPKYEILSDDELTNRLTKAYKQHTAYNCLKCGTIFAMPSRTGDGRTCICCSGGPIVPIGYVRQKGGAQ